MSQTGVVKEVLGIVKAINQNGESRVLVVGDRVNNNEIIETIGQNSKIKIVFNDGKELNLENGEKSLLDESVISSEPFAPEDVNAIQQAILNGEELPQEETAAGNELARDGGFDPAYIAHLNDYRGDVSSYNLGTGYLKTDNNEIDNQIVEIRDIDDAPEVSGEFTGSVNEGDIGDTVTATGTISISDVDVDDNPSFADTTVVGTYGTLVLSNGTWTYTLDQSKVQDLDAGDIVTDTITLTADDNTTQDIDITITGTDDAPEVSGEFTGSVNEGDIGDTVTATGTISISDVDADDNPSFADTTVVGTYGTLVLSNGTWTYTLDQSKVQDLDAGDIVTDTVTLTADDNTTQDIEITITGTNDQPIINSIMANTTLSFDNSNWFDNDNGMTIVGYENDGSIVTPTVYSRGLGITNQIAEGNPGSEAIKFDFEQDFNSATVELSMFYGSLNEVAQWTAYKDGVEVATGLVNAPANTTTSSFDINTGSVVFDSLKINPLDDAADDTNDFYIKSLQVSNRFFYETSDMNSNDSDASFGDILTVFNGNLATAQDDDASSSNTYHLDGAVMEDSGVVTDLSVVINPQSGDYTISGNFNALASGETSTVTFSYFANDGEGFDGTNGLDESSISVSKTVTLTITGTNDQPVVENVYVGNILVVEDFESGATGWSTNIVADGGNATNFLGRFGSGDTVSKEFDLGIDYAGKTVTLSFDMYEIDSWDGAVGYNNEGEEAFKIIVNGNESSYIMGHDGRSEDISDGGTPIDNIFGSWSDESHHFEQEVVVDENGKVNLTLTSTLHQSLGDESWGIDNLTIVAGKTIYEADTGLNTFSGLLPEVIDNDISDTHEYLGVTGNNSDIDYIVNSPVPVTISSIIVNTDGTYQIEGDFNALSEGEVATITFQYYVNDKQGFDGTDSINENSLSEPKSVTITITGTDDAPVLDLYTEVETSVSYNLEKAGYDNVVGVYTLAANGNPENPTIILTNTKDQNYRHLLNIENNAENIKFFIVADGEKNIDFDRANSFSFVQKNGEWKISVDGTVLSNKYVYFSDSNLNHDDKDHFKLTYNGNGSYNLNIEDLPNLGDKDFQDVVLTLNEKDISGTGYETIFEEAAKNDLGTGPVSVVGNGISIIDVDDTNIQSATVTLKDAKEGDFLQYNETTYSSVDSNGNIVLSLSFAGTLSDYQTALSNIKFGNLSSNPDESDRFIDIVVNDSNKDSNVATTVIHINNNEFYYNSSTNIDGGAGEDVLIVDSMQTDINLSNVDNIEILEFRNDSNTISVGGISAEEIFNLNDSHEVSISGEGEVVLDNSTWTRDIHDTSIYKAVYNGNDVILHIDGDITVNYQ